MRAFLLGSSKTVLAAVVEAVDNLGVLSDPSYVIISLADDSFTRMATCLLLIH